MSTHPVDGRAGDIGTRLRKILKPVYPDLRLSDVKKPADLGPTSSSSPPILHDWRRSRRSCDGIDGVIHLGGFSDEGPWETILQSNIIGCYNLFEAARQARRQAGRLRLLQPCGRLLSAPPPHRHRRHRAAGFPLRRQQGVRRGAGLALRRQAWAARAVPAHRQRRRQAARQAPAVDLGQAAEDLAQLMRIGLEHPDLRFEIFYGASWNERAWWDNQPAPTTTAIGPTGAPRTTSRTRMAAQAKLKPDPVGDFFQGGTFCSAGVRRRHVAHLEAALRAFSWVPACPRSSAQIARAADIAFASVLSFLESAFNVQRSSSQARLSLGSSR